MASGGARVEEAQTAFAGRAWSAAYAAYQQSARHGELDAVDYERMAICAYLLGEDDACAAAWEEAHRAHRAAGQPAESARCAFWLAFSHMMRGQMAQAGAWLARVELLVGEVGGECAAAGYLRIPAVLQALDSDEPATARDLAVEAIALGAACDDADLRAFGTLGHGHALIAMGEVAEGLARLDEVMVMVTANEAGPITAGIAYCAVVLECMQLFDLRRASEWTDALTAWCETQPDLVPFRGQCLVHRSQLQQAAGAWRDAADSVEAACRRLTDPPHPALGMAHYQQAELHRLRGEFDAAADAYRRAGRHGYHPMPGLALLELARGDAEGAATSIARALHESTARLERRALLPAAVEIHRAAGDTAAARAAADELIEMVEEGVSSPSVGLIATARQALGAVLLAEGDPVAALVELRASSERWQALSVPYEVARTAVLRGLACTALGDRSSADLELDTARQIFTELGATPDLARLGALTPSERPLLSAREAEVLRLLAAGKTNKEIAAALVISQHTAGRHVENIFTKLGVTSRAAATAYAYEHSLL